MNKMRNYSFPAIIFAKSSIVLWAVCFQDMFWALFFPLATNSSRKFLDSIFLMAFLMSVVEVGSINSAAPPETSFGAPLFVAIAGMPAA